jgi:hypothetical protein
MTLRSKRFSSCRLDFPDFRYRDISGHGAALQDSGLIDRAVGGDAGVRVAGCAPTGAFAVDAIEARGSVARRCLVVQLVGAAPDTIPFFSGGQRRSF